MRLSERSVAFEKAALLQRLENACHRRAVARLRIVDDAPAIEAAVQAGRDPAGHRAAGMRRLGQQLDQRLLPPPQAR
jgi:hypothetical protein